MATDDKHDTTSVRFTELLFYQGHQFSWQSNIYRYKVYRLSRMVNFYNDVCISE